MISNKYQNRKSGRPRKKIEDKLSKVLTTDKQKAFLKNRIAGMNKRQAAIQAGYAPSTASIMAKKITDRLSCNTYFIEEAQRQGLTIEAIIDEIKRGMTESMHQKHTNQPDNFNRRAYTDMAIKIYGGYAPTKFDIQKDSRELAVSISVDTIRKAEAITGEKILDEFGNAIRNNDEEETQLLNRKEDH